MKININKVESAATDGSGIEAMTPSETLKSTSADVTSTLEDMDRITEKLTTNVSVTDNIIGDSETVFVAGTLRCQLINEDPEDLNGKRIIAVVNGRDLPDLNITADTPVADLDRLFNLDAGLYFIDRGSDVKAFVGMTELNRRLSWNYRINNPAVVKSDELPEAVRNVLNRFKPKVEEVRTELLAFLTQFEELKKKIQLTGMKMASLVVTELEVEDGNP
jgi:hypothetical protein